MSVLREKFWKEPGRKRLSCRNSVYTFDVNCGGNKKYLEMFEIMECDASIKLYLKI